MRSRGRAIVRVDHASHRTVEAFLTRELGEGTPFPRAVYLVAGFAGALVAACAGAHAITFGSAVFLSRAAQRTLDRSGGPGTALGSLGPLLVHECVHAAQYRRDGAVGFLASYLLSYYKNLNVVSIFSRPARDRAYRAIPQEREAFALEASYAFRLGRRYDLPHGCASDKE